MDLINHFWLNVLMRKWILIFCLVVLLFLGYFSGFTTYIYTHFFFRPGNVEVESILDIQEYFTAVKPDLDRNYTTGVYGWKYKDYIYIWVKGLKVFHLDRETKYIERYKCGKVVGKSQYSNIPVVFLSEELEKDVDKQKMLRAGDFILLVTKKTDNSPVSFIDTVFKVDLELFIKGRDLIKCR